MTDRNQTGKCPRTILEVLPYADRTAVVFKSGCGRFKSTLSGKISGRGKSKTRVDRNFRSKLEVNNGC